MAFLERRADREGRMRMASEFKAFLNQGNVLGLAVGVIIGGVFGKIVTSLTEDVIMPFITLITGGGVDFSSKYMVLSGTVPEGSSLAAARAAGANVLAWGSFITAIINFVIMAFVIFMIVRQANKLNPPPPGGPSEVDLLTEIRDSLKK
jgi:large conductance mechanosensitive channel